MASTSKSAKYNTNCCVYGCHSRKGADRSLHFHSFPKNNSGISVKVLNRLGQEELIDRRKAWERVLLMGKPVTDSMRVCSKHFRNEDYCARGVMINEPNSKPKLIRTAVPSLNLPKKRQHSSLASVSDDSGQGSSNPRKERAAKRQKMKESQDESSVDAKAETVETLDIGSDKWCDDTDSRLVQTQTHISYEQLSMEEKVAVQSLYNLRCGESASFSVDKQVQVSSGDLFISFSSTIKQDSHLNSLTGIGTMKLLDSLTELVKKMYPDQKAHKLSVKDRILLVFMKLKMGIKLTVLSFLFKIAPSTCKIVFVKYVGYLAEILKSSIYWPTSEECQKNMPTCFNNFRGVRIVLDCLEIPIEKPKCLCCRVRTYSHYKGRQTLKVMIGVSPAGLITFVSKTYGGRSSDKAIFTQSGLIYKLNPRQDSIMVDKGFLIDDICAQNFIKIIRPYFLRNKKQFTEEESKENVLISRARVHIERVNQRLRIFSIINNPLPITFIPSIDNIMLIISAMVNLQAPILSENRF